MGTARPGGGRRRGPHGHTAAATACHRKGGENSTRIKDGSAGTAAVKRVTLLRQMYRRCTGLGAPSSRWKASGSGLPVPKGMAGNSPSRAIALGAGSEGEKPRTGQVTRTWGAQRDLQDERLCLKGTHFWLAGKLLPLASREVLAEFTGLSSGNKTGRREDDGHGHIPDLGTPKGDLLSPQGTQRLFIRDELHSAFPSRRPASSTASDSGKPCLLLPPPHRWSPLGDHWLLHQHLPPPAGEEEDKDAALSAAKKVPFTVLVSQEVAKQVIHRP